MMSPGATSSTVRWSRAHETRNVVVCLPTNFAMNPLLFGFLMGKARGQSDADAARNAIVGQAWKTAVPDPVERTILKTLAAPAPASPSLTLDAAINRLRGASTSYAVRDATGDVASAALNTDPTARFRALQALESVASSCGNALSLERMADAVLSIATHAPAPVQAEARRILRSWRGSWSNPYNLGRVTNALNTIGW